MGRQRIHDYEAIRNDYLSFAGGIGEFARTRGYGTRTLYAAFGEVGMTPELKPQFWKKPAQPTRRKRVDSYMGAYPDVAEARKAGRSYRWCMSHLRVTNEIVRRVSRELKGLPARG